MSNLISSFHINGDSMKPLLKDGDLVLGFEQVELKHLKKFDILIFEYKNTFFCHYLWNIVESFNDKNVFLQTRPLNPVWGKDDPIPFENLLAKVINKKIPLFLRFKIYFFSLIFKTGLQ